MNCSICGQPVVLVPSAQDRARKDVCGNTAAYYTRLFTLHSDCFIEKRGKETLELVRRLTKP